MCGKHDNTISVIIPVYNTEKYLEECLDSAIGQTKSFDKIIIVDDGSIDSSSEIMDEYAKVNPNVIVIHQDNRGPGNARNNGLAIVDSEYVMFLDSDDVLAINAVEMLSNALDSWQPDTIYFDGVSFKYGLNEKNDTREYIRGISQNAHITLFNGDEFFAESYKTNYIAADCFALYKTDLMKRVMFPDGIVFEDTYTTFAYMLNAERIIALPAVLYYRRIREGSITNEVFSTKTINDLCIVYKLIFIFIHSSDFNTINGSLAEYALDNMLYILLVFQKYASTICIQNVIPELVDSLREGMRILKKLCIWETVYVLGVRVKAFQVIASISALGLEDMFELDHIKHELTTSIDSGMRLMLGNIDLSDPNTNVAVYGVGEHTKGFLKAYEFFKGKILANITFIATNPQKDETFMGKKIVACKDLDRRIDLVVISSCIHQTEMIETLLLYYPDIKIFKFYNSDYERDCFSWINRDFFRYYIEVK